MGLFDLPSLILLALVLNQVVETALWGTTAYVTFRVLGGRDSRWYIGVFLAFVVFLAYEYGVLYPSSQKIMQYGASQDERIMQLLKEAIVRSNMASEAAVFLASVVISFAKIAIGFKIAQWVLAKRISNSTTPS